VTAVPPSLTRSQFRAVATNATGSATSDAATLVVRTVVVDADGDGRADLAIFRPSNGTWYTRYSAQGYSTATAVQWGLPGDIPISGDFDGDGKIELTIFRPSNGTWYVRYSSLGYAPGSVATFQWGLPGDVPVPGDYDGDRKLDYAVYRPSTGQWFVLMSRSRFTTYFIRQWGLSTDVPLPPPR